jgi:hypothetical protein
MPEPDITAPAATATEPATTAGAAARGLRLQVELYRPQAGAAWTASLQVPGAAAPLPFACLAELIAFLSQLDPSAPGRGLR